MSSAVRGGLVLLFLFTLLPDSAEAGLFCNRCQKARRPRHCHSCQKVNCTTCAPPVNCCVCPPVQEMHPVVETRYRQEQVVTPRTVVETHYRSET